MGRKLHSHKVTITERRRDNKKGADIMKKDGSKGSVKDLFNSYYKDQVRALYRAVTRD